MMSNKKSKYPVLQVDLRLHIPHTHKYEAWPNCISLMFLSVVVEVYFLLFRLISDLVVVIVSAAIGGIIFSCLGQPVCVSDPDFSCSVLSFFVLGSTIIALILRIYEK